MSPTATRLALAALAVLAGVPAAAQNRPAAARFEVVGRAPVTHTRTTDLAVFRGVDGRDYAYTGTFAGCPGCRAGRMYAWDVTDPAHPRLTDSVTVDALTVNDVAVNAAGTLAVLTREGARSQRNGIVVLDLKDPAHPRQVGEYWETLTGGAHNVWLDGDKAYVVDQGGSEMAIIDLAMPNDPLEIGRWGVPNSPNRFLQDVAVKDGLAYLSYWNDGLVIVDVGNGVREGTPRRPKLVGQYRYRVEWRGERYGNTAYAFPYTNQAGKKYVFVGDQIMPRMANLGQRFDTGGYVHVLDVSDPAVPREVAAYSAPSSGVHSFWIANDTMYVAAWTGGLRAVDVSGQLSGDLRNREIASLSTTDEQTAVRNFPFAWAAVPHNGLVFASDFNSGLWIARLVPGSTAATP
ncbi:MAG TPA: hypothetical protein VFJ16_26530 [Longimicrobium sp.]|nr:hypothetical protein [Longimicrobium sp.]